MSHSKEDQSKITPEELARQIAAPVLPHLSKEIVDPWLNAVASRLSKEMGIPCGEDRMASEGINWDNVFVDER